MGLGLERLINNWICRLVSRACFSISIPVAQLVGGGDLFVADL